MTMDFVDDVVDMLDANGYPYIIIVEHPKGNGAWVKSDVSKWIVADGKSTIKEDINQLLDVTVFK